MKFYAFQYRNNENKEKIRIAYGPSRADVAAHLIHGTPKILFPVSPSPAMLEQAEKQMTEGQGTTDTLTGWIYDPNEHVRLRSIRKFRKGKVK